MIDLCQNLLSNIEERENILFEIERSIFTGRYGLSKKHYEILSVQSISMIYSIWEGFIQNSFQMYIEYINSLNIDFHLLSENIQIFHLENSFKQFKNYPEKNIKKKKFYNELNEFYKKKNHILYNKIDTKSNVNLKILNSLFKIFHLVPFDSFWKKYKHPNSNLGDTMNTFIKYRNTVSHGGDISSEEKVNKKVYVKYKTLISDLMYAIREKMKQGIQNKTYLK